MQTVWQVIDRWCAVLCRGADALRARGLVCFLGFSCLVTLVARGTPVRAAVEVPMSSPETPIYVNAEQYTRWHEGRYEVLLLQGECEIAQDAMWVRSRDAVLWILPGDPQSQVPTKIIAYLETDVVLSHRETGVSLKDQSWLGRFHTHSRVHLQMSDETAGPATTPAVLRRGRAAREWQSAAAVQPVQFTAPQILPPGNEPRLPPSARTLTISPRNGTRPSIKVNPLEAPTNETTAVVSGGARISIAGIQNVPGLLTSTITVDADRIVVWTDALGGAGALAMGGQQPLDGNYEFYLEGNVVFREGDRVIYADRMYYHATRQQGLILNAEALTPIQDYEGLMRLKADVLQQLDESNFLAYGAAITSSRLGVPRYWVQAGNVTLQDVQQPVVDPFTGQSAPDLVEHQLLATSRNNLLYVGGLPVIYWPVLATDLLKPTFYVDRVRFGSDSVFGNQAQIDWDLYQLLGLTKQLAPGSDWTLSTDWLSERGFALGTNFEYQGDGLFTLPGPYQGFIDAWGLHDEGTDNLGRDRRALLPEEDFRGRILWQHRHRIPGGYQVTGEFGLISDRNFLEQFFESEWDQGKDQTTNLELKRLVANSSWSLYGQARLNDFFTQTEWLPRFDHYLLGQSFLGDRMTWHAHSHVGYANLRVADPPSLLTPLQAKFDPLAWERNREGIHAATRHEIDMPLQLGPVKVVPFAGGEMFQVGEDIAGQKRTRALGQAGARTSVSLWHAEPCVQSTLFNLNGLAHKVELESEFLWADAEENMDRFPLYEELDDDSIEFFRRRFFFDTFGGMVGGDVPLRFDERFFALRSGMQRNVTAPSTAIADDLMLVKLGARQRWQTKRGPPGRERIIDWVVLDVEGTYFPKADRDNFGQEFGLFDYDFRWHVGDRLTLLSDGFADLFGDGLRTFTVGGVITRPERGQVYLGFRTIEGPISSSILTGSTSYRMSEKWILTGGTSIDFAATGNIGQFLALTRIGESALIQLGFTADVSRGNVGVRFAIEPRFLASNRLGFVGGVQTAPAGARGLE